MTRSASLTHNQQTSGNKKAEEDADKDTDKKVAEIKKVGKDAGPKVCQHASQIVVGVLTVRQVVKNLLTAVMEVKPEAPEITEQPTL